jgi:3-dehydroquinate dehydratase
MSQFINSTDEMRRYVPSILGGVSFTNFVPAVRRVTRYYVEPHFPKALISRLLNPLSTGSLTAVENDILEFLKEAVAGFAEVETSITGAVQHTGSGLQQMQSDTLVDAKKYAKDDYRTLIEAGAYASLESALRYAVEAIHHVGGDYAESNHYTKTIARLVNFTSDFEGSGYNIGRKTLILMLPHIALVEREVVAPFLGETLYNDLKIHQYTEGTLIPKKIELLQLYREGLAQYAVQIAQDLELIQFVGGHVYEREKLGDDASDKRGKVRTDVYALVQRTRNEYAARYFTQAKKFLAANATVLGWTDPTPSVSETSATAFIGFLKK